MFDLWCLGLKIQIYDNVHSQSPKLSHTGINKIYYTVCNLPWEKNKAFMLFFFGVMREGEK